MTLFEDFLTEQNDEIYEAAFELIKAMTRDPEMEWDMQYIGEVVDTVAETLDNLGLETCYPFYSESEDEYRVACWLTDECDNTGCPMRCQHFCENNGVVLLVFASAVKEMIEDLGNGDATANGDRTSRYVKIAHGMGDRENKFVEAALVEEKAGLEAEHEFYSLHIIDDLNDRDGVIISTNNLDYDELYRLMADILGKLARGEKL